MGSLNEQSRMSLSALLVRHINEFITYLIQEVIMSQKYMLIFHGGFYDSLSPDEAQKQMQKWFMWIDKLRNTGKYQEGEALIHGGKILSQKNGKVVVDGPFAESKESVAGYFVVEAPDLNAAVEISRDYPDFPLGGKVEVREVMKIEMPA
jgi:hypothetical protein